VEDGIVILIGATTENPFFEVNSPLISRCTVFRTETLSPLEISAVIRSALEDPVRGLGGRITLEEPAAEALNERVGGDARLALNSLDVAAAIARGRGTRVIGLDDITEALQRRVIRYDKAGDRHYDVISAFIKSVRGSDPDAALYWLHTMLEAGEDPKFIARRLVILASEDVGLAESRGLGVAVDAFRAIEVIGLPEGAYALSHAAVFLSLAPKSNSIRDAIARTRELVENTPSAAVPPHLRSAASEGQRALGDGVGYVYPHDHPEALIPQQYLPDEVTDAVLYLPNDRGEEGELSRRLEEIDARLGKRPRR